MITKGAFNHRLQAELKAVMDYEYKEIGLLSYPEPPINYSKGCTCATCVSYRDGTYINLVLANGEPPDDPTWTSIESDWQKIQGAQSFSIKDAQRALNRITSRHLTQKLGTP